MSLVTRRDNMGSKLILQRYASRFSERFIRFLLKFPVTIIKLLCRIPLHNFIVSPEGPWQFLSRQAEKAIAVFEIASLRWR